MKKEGITLTLTGALAEEFVNLLANNVAEKTEFRPPDDELMVSSTKGAKMLGVHPDTFRAIASREGFRSKPIGRETRYNKEDIRKFAEDRD